MEKCSGGWYLGWFESWIYCWLVCLKCPSSIGDEGVGVRSDHVRENDGVVMLFCCVVVACSCCMSSWSCVSLGIYDGAAHADDDCDEAGV